MISTLNKRKSMGILFKGFVSENFVWVILILIIIVAGIINPVFFSYQNIINLLLHSVILGILVLGESLCFITGRFDLSIESTLIFSAVGTAMLISSDKLSSGLQLHPILGVLFLFVAGASIGLINGLFIAYLEMNPFITTLAMSIVFLGISIFWSKGNTIYPLPDNYNFLGQAKIGIIPVSIIVLTYTPFGRKLYIVGGNIDAARASGINTKLIILLAYILSGVLAACAGWILSGRLSSGSPQMISGILLYVFAAAVIGGISLSGGKGRAIGALGGVLLLSSINTFMNLAHIDPFLIKATSGIIILIAMFIDSMKSKGFLST